MITFEQDMQTAGCDIHNPSPKSRPSSSMSPPSWISCANSFSHSRMLFAAVSSFLLTFNGYCIACRLSQVNHGIDHVTAQPVLTFMLWLCSSKQHEI